MMSPMPARGASIDGPLARGHSAGAHRRPSRRPRSRWRDPRLVVGIAVVAVCTLLGARLLGGADDTVAVWAARGDAQRGAAGRRRRPGTPRGAVRRPGGRRPLPLGRRRPAGGRHAARVPSGPASCCRGARSAPPGPAPLTEVPLSVDTEAVPSTVRVGSTVDVWVTPDGAAHAEPARPAASTLVFDDVAVVSAPRTGTSLGPDRDPPGHRRGRRGPAGRGCRRRSRRWPPAPWCSPSSDERPRGAGPRPGAGRGGRAPVGGRGARPARARRARAGADQALRRPDRPARHRRARGWPSVAVVVARRCPGSTPTASTRCAGPGSAWSLVAAPEELPDGDTERMRRLGIDHVLASTELDSLAGRRSPSAGRRRARPPTARRPGTTPSRTGAGVARPAGRRLGPGRRPGPHHGRGRPRRRAGRGGHDTLLLDADPYGGAVAQHLGVLDEVSGLLAAARAANAGQLDADRLAGLARQVGDAAAGADRAAPRRPVAGGAAAPRSTSCSTQAAAARGVHVVLDTGFSLEARPGRPVRRRRAAAQPS